MAILGAKDQSSCLPRFIFQKSVTWACPVAMEAFVYVIGAGGSGAHVGHSQDTTHNCNGGGAGGCAISRLSLVAQNYTVTIGSGGARTAGDNNGSAGSAGGDSVFSGSGIDTMTGSGGNGGSYGSNASAVTGGSASGGNISNNTGGGSPAASAQYSVSGGGGVNFGAAASQCDGDHQTNVEFTAGGSMRGVVGQGNSGSDYTAHMGKYFDGRNLQLGFDMFNIGMHHIIDGTQYYDAGSSTSEDRTQGGCYTIKSGDRRRFTFYNSSGLVYVFPAGPFEGGNSHSMGWGSSTTSEASAGGVGGGGGASLNRSNGGTNYSGAGGSGLVMIFPITMG